MLIISLKEDVWLQLQIERVREVLPLWLPRGGMDEVTIWSKLADIGIGLNYTDKDKIAILSALEKSSMVKIVDDKAVGFWKRINPFNNNKSAEE